MRPMPPGLTSPEGPATGVMPIRRCCARGLVTTPDQEGRRPGPGVLFDTACKDLVVRERRTTLFAPVHKVAAARAGKRRIAGELQVLLRTLLVIHGEEAVHGGYERAHKRRSLELFTRLGPDPPGSSRLAVTP